MNTNELGLLIHAVRNKDAGFYLVECADNVVQDDLILKMKVALGRSGKKTAVLDFAEKKKDETVIDFINSRVNASPDVHVFFIRNLEEAADDNPENFLRQLNQSRESIYSFRKNFVFLIYPGLAKVFTAFARDLFSWIPHRFRFEEGRVTPREFGQSLRMDERVRFKGDKDRKHIGELIGLYEKQLKEAPGDESFRMENIIEPLAGLYEEIGDYEKEIPLRLEVAHFYRGDRDRYAGAMNNLGIAYWSLPTGDRGENLKKAIEAYEEALKVYSDSAFADDNERVEKLLQEAEKELRKTEMKVGG